MERGLRNPPRPSQNPWIWGGARAKRVAEDFKMKETEETKNTHNKKKRILTLFYITLGTCIVATYIAMYANPFLIDAFGSSYDESQLLFNILISPAVGLLVTIVVGVIGFVCLFRK